MDLSHGTPISRSASSGTVISDSTSAADSPSASVLTCSVSGENSGTTSRGIWRICQTPPISSTAAIATTNDRRRKQPTVSHIMTAPPWGRIALRAPYSRCSLFSRWRIERSDSKFGTRRNWNEHTSLVNMASIRKFQRPMRISFTRLGASHRSRSPALASRWDRCARFETGVLPTATARVVVRGPRF